MPHDESTSSQRAFPLARVARLVAVLLVVSAGCKAKAPVPGVTYTASAIVKGEDGTVRDTDEPAVQVQSGVVGDDKEVLNEGKRFLVHVRKTSYGEAILEVTLPDNSTQTLKIKVGQTKDVLPRGQNHGVRIAVQDCH